MVASQLKIPTEQWSEYGKREQTRREHLIELKLFFGFKSFTMSYYKKEVTTLTELALQTTKGIVLAKELVENLRKQSILLPSIGVIERMSAEAITQANRKIYAILTESLSDETRKRLDELFQRKGDLQTTWLSWLRQSPAKPNSRYMLEHIDRLKKFQSLGLPTDVEKKIHQNRLLKLSREGWQMTPADLIKFESQRRYATLVAMSIERMATVTDEIIDLHDRILGRLFNAAKNKHREQFQRSSKEINEKVHLYGRIGQILLDAKEKGGDPFAAIESVMPWDIFSESVSEAQRLAQPENFDFLHRVIDGYSTIRRYAPEFLNILRIHASSSAESIVKAVDLLRLMNAENSRKIPEGAPTDFVKKRWEKLVITKDGIDRRYYELSVLSELKNALRSGDIWVQGSRQFKNFHEYLIAPDSFAIITQVQRFL